MIDSPDVDVDAKQTLLSQYHVNCSITGKPIPIPEIKYWNCEKQIPYIGPEVIPKSDFYQDIVGDTLETTKT